MVGLFEKKEFSKKINQIESSLKNAFEKVREEFDDHLDSINENTNELQMHYEYMTQLDVKITKLSEKIDDLHMLLKQVTMQQQPFLSRQEQKIFLTLYTFGEESPLSQVDIANRLNLNELTVRSALAAMVKKGIPVIEEKIDEKLYYKFSREFKEQQAKENIVRLDEDIVIEAI